MIITLSSSLWARIKIRAIGYLGDANTDQWAATVQQIKLKYPNAEIVIPGHGKPGGTELLEYTIKLFEEK